MSTPSFFLAAEISGPVQTFLGFAADSVSAGGTGIPNGVPGAAPAPAATSGVAVPDDVAGCPSPPTRGAGDRQGAGTPCTSGAPPRAGPQLLERKS
eukprot:7575036-Pyramimonas_sp.AAC.1